MLAGSPGVRRMADNNVPQPKTIFMPAGLHRYDSAVNERSTHMLEHTRLTHPSEGPTGLQSKRVVDSVSGLGDLPDLLLVERTRGRDARAFETLMRRYNRRLYRIARSILSDNDAAEEAVRAAHIRAYANLDRYEPAGKFGAWLARLALNEALNLRRHSAPGTPLITSTPTAAAPV